MNAARLALAVALAVFAVASAERKVEDGAARARTEAEAFMRAHAGGPDDADLQQIQFQAPAAYAIVKALLVKRDLGLLDPHRPTASMLPQKKLGPSKEDEATLARMEVEQSSQAPPTPMIAMQGAELPLERPAHTASLFEGGADLGVRSFAWRPPQDTDGLDLDSVLQGAATAQKQDSLLAEGGSLDPKLAPARAGPRKDTASGRFWTGFSEGMLAIATKPVNAKPAPAVAMAQGAEAGARVQQKVEARPTGVSPPAQLAPTVAADKSNALQSFDWAAPTASEEAPHVASLAAKNSYLSSVGLSEDPPAPSRNPYLESRGPGARPAHRDLLVQAPQPSAPRVDARKNPLGAWFSMPAENAAVLSFLQAGA